MKGLSVLCVYKGENGEEKTDILSMCDYRNTENMNLEELEKYYNELEEQYDDIEGDEPDESQNEEYEAWVEYLEEIEDEMDSVKEKMEALKGNPQNNVRDKRRKMRNCGKWIV